MEKVELLRKVECDNNFSLRKVFKAMLNAAKGTRPPTKAEDLVKTIFFMLSYKDFDRVLVSSGPIRRDKDFS